ncbi:carbon-nitrogen hydrolase [Ascodesmis nigricans]|uniref:Carbon-nitrogen hydrolase n=1 Tax=Ascodesmis nigricans TaxID=341454 RepID=A0A4S2MQC9_9PEZI|nr:carbon-nitrogen hydrolase [Ascodesmis nigricans]
MAPLTLTVAQYGTRPTLRETLDLLHTVTIDAAGTGTNLLVFPEAFLGGYPRGQTFGSIIGSRTSEGRDEYYAYWKNAVDLGDTHPEGLGTYTHPGDGTGLELEKIARETGVFLVVGLVEKVKGSGSLYCAVIYVDPKKGIVGKRRKVMPTAAERVIWSVGSPATLKATDISLASQPITMASVICWENYHPLIRAALYQQGVDLYIAPTADARPQWQSTVQHIAMEGRCVVLSCNQFIPPPEDENPAEEEEEGAPEDAYAKIKGTPGGSVIFGPLGECMAGPLWGEEGVLSVTFEEGEWERRIVGSRLDFDVGRGGHYGRADAFKLTVAGLMLGEEKLKEKKK